MLAQKSELDFKFGACVGRAKNATLQDFTKTWIRRRNISFVKKVFFVNCAQMFFKTGNTFLSAEKKHPSFRYTERRRKKRRKLIYMSWSLAPSESKWLNKRGGKGREGRGAKRFFYFSLSFLPTHEGERKGLRAFLFSSFPPFKLGRRAPSVVAGGSN